MPQRLPQPEHAPGAIRRPEQHAGHGSRRLVVVQPLVDLGRRGGDILDHLLKQRVVVIGQHLDQAGPRLVRAIHHLRRHGSAVRRHPEAVAVGALADHVDVAHDRLTLAYRHVAQDERARGEALQSGHRVPRASREHVDAVDEHQRWHAVAVEQAQQRRRRSRPAWVRLAHDDREVGIGDGQLRRVGKFH